MNQKVSFESALGSGKIALFDYAKVPYGYLSSYPNSLLACRVGVTAALECALQEQKIEFEEFSPLYEEISKIIILENYREVANQIAAAADSGGGQWRFELHEACGDPVPHGDVLKDEQNFGTVHDLISALQQIIPVAGRDNMTVAEAASLIAAMVAGNLPTDPKERVRLQLDLSKQVGGLRGFISSIFSKVR